jgi:N-acetylated-alpha-linked acidic dipeptidase
MIDAVRRCRVLFACALLAAPFAAEAQQPIRGYPVESYAARAALETRLRAVPEPDSMRVWIRRLSAEPHTAGQPGSRRVAEQLRDRFRSFGLEAELERFEALLPMPLTRELELLGREPYVAVLAEPPLAADGTSAEAVGVPTWNAYSPDGAVTAPLVYVNYGTPEDYAVLDSLGISVAGTIVIARYGRSWRGIKPKVAAERGALATLIYSDPRDDGYWHEDVYPEGPMRPPTGVQRGSVMDMPRYPGDPQTPGWGSVDGARKLPLDSIITFSPIPVLPLGYGDAEPLLRSLGGPVAPESWRGALPLTYRIGPGTADVRLRLEFDWSVRPLYNVVARIPGSVWPDQWVVLGNHHDAWVNGAEDPISGMVAVTEAARALAALLDGGWRPARTIVIAGWDGEEWGLIGSTEWGEHHRAALDQSGVAYFNSDSNSKGWLNAGGSHSLERFMEEVARDIHDPERGVSVLEAQLARRAATSTDTATERRFRLDALGSGSDWTVFLDHLGMAAVHANYGGDGPSGIYHSAYDSFDFYARFKDPTWRFGVAQAQTLATMVVRMADAPVLPFEYGSAVQTYRGYVDEIEKRAAADPRMNGLDLRAVRAALDRLERVAEAHERVVGELARTSSAALAARRDALGEANAVLYRAERRLSDDAGLPDRPWFRNLVYAPGFYTGYGVKTMPGIREAVEDLPDLAVAQREAARVAAALDAYAAEVERATALLARVR